MYTKLLFINVQASSIVKILAFPPVSHHSRLPSVVRHQETNDKDDRAESRLAPGRTCSPPSPARWGCTGAPPSAWRRDVLGPLHCPHTPASCAHVVDRSTISLRAAKNLGKSSTQRDDRHFFFYFIFGWAGASRCFRFVGTLGATSG